MAGRSVLDKTSSTITIEGSGLGFKKNELVTFSGRLTSLGPVGDILGSSGLASFRPIWSRTRFVSSARALKTNSTSGSRRPVSPSPCRTTPRCTRGGRLTDLAMKLSEFIGFPIVLHVEKSKEKAVTDSGDDEQDNRGGR